MTGLLGTINALIRINILNLGLPVSSETYRVRKFSPDTGVYGFPHQIGRASCRERVSSPG